MPLWPALEAVKSASVPWGAGSYSALDHPIQTVNVLGTYFTATAFLPLLKKASEHHKQEASKNPDGRIDYVPQVILVSSNASVVKWVLSGSKDGVA